MKCFSNEDLMWMYRKLVLLRQAEERLVQLSNQGKVGTLLAGVGQEAIPVGAVKTMGSDDKWAPSHRGVCDMVVKDGVELKYVYAEVYGKATSAEKSTWPGVSSKVIRVSPTSKTACLEKIVMPLALSSS